MVKYPRLYISNKVYSRVAKYAKKNNLTKKEAGEVVANAGLKSLKA